MPCETSSPASSDTPKGSGKRSGFRPQPMPDDEQERLEWLAEILETAIAGWDFDGRGGVGLLPEVDDTVRARLDEKLTAAFDWVNRVFTSPTAKRASTVVLDVTHFSLANIIAQIRDGVRGQPVLGHVIEACRQCAILLSLLAESRRPKERPPARHSADFSCVDWFGTSYAFTATQAAIVTLLWGAWEDCVPDLRDAFLLEKADCGDTVRLRDVFRNHPAWGTMIVSGKKDGIRRLADPGE